MDLSLNPWYNNALVLDLLSWEIVTREEAEGLWKNPWLEAERVEQTGLRSVVHVRVLRWQLEFAASDSPVAQRWPHCVFPPLAD